MVRLVKLTCQEIATISLPKIETRMKIALLENFEAKPQTIKPTAWTAIVIWAVERAPLRGSRIQTKVGEKIPATAAMLSLSEYYENTSPE